MIVLDANNIQLAKSSTIPLDKTGISAGTMNSLSRRAVKSTSASSVDLASNVITLAGHGFTELQPLTVVTSKDWNLNGFGTDSAYFAHIIDSNRFQIVTSNVEDAGTNPILLAGTDFFIVNFDLAPPSDNSTTNSPKGVLVLGYNEASKLIDALSAVQTGGTLEVANHGWSTGDLINYSVVPSNAPVKVDLNRSNLFRPSLSELTFDPSDPDAGVSDNTIFIPDSHVLVTGQRVVYSSGLGGSPIGGLNEGQAYYVTNTDEFGFQLANTQQDAFAGLFIPLTSSGNGTSHKLLVDTVNLDENQIVIRNHQLQTGQIVTYIEDKSNSRSILNDRGAITLTGHNLEVESHNGSRILAVTGSLSLAEQSSLALGLAGSFALNSIEGITQAVVDGTQVPDAGNVSVAANRDDKVFAVTISAAGTLPNKENTTKAFGLSVDASAAVSINSIHTVTLASIENSPVLKTSGSSNVSSTNGSQVFALSGGAALALSVGKGTRVSVSAGVSVGLNEIENSVDASVLNSTIDAGNELVVFAEDKSKVKSIVIGGSLALAAGINNGVGIAGAGAGAVNKIDSNTTATIKDSHVKTGGNTIVWAKDTSTISADGGGVAVALSIGGTEKSGAASVGASVAHNEIGNKNTSGVTSATIEGSIVDAIGSIFVLSLVDSKIEALTLAGSLAASLGGEGSVALSGAGADSKNKINRKLIASIIDSPSIASDLDVDVHAFDQSSIRSRTAGFGLAASSSPAGVSGALSVGVALGKNEIGGSIDAHVIGSLIDATGDVSVLANTLGPELFRFDEVSTLNASQLDDATEQQSDDPDTSIDEYTLDKNHDEEVILLLGQQFALQGIKLSSQVRLAQQSKGNSWILIDERLGQSWIVTKQGSTLIVTRPNVEAVTAAASVAISSGMPSLSLSGGGAESTNLILNKLAATVENSSIAHANDLTINAVNSSGIVSTIVAASLGIAANSQGSGLVASVGATRAQNFIGYTEGGDRVPATAVAKLDQSSLNVDGSVSVNGLANQSISGLSLAVSVAFSSQDSSVALSGAGASTSNKVAAAPQAIVNNLTGSIVHADSMTVSALDRSRIRALAGGVSVAGVGSAVAALSIGVGLADNLVSTYALANISNSTLTSDSSGKLTVSAEELASIDAVAFAASLALAIADGTSYSVTGAGAHATNKLTSRTNAIISTSDIDWNGDVSVTASNSANVDALVLTIATGVGGLGLSIGAALADNFVEGSQVYAKLEDSSLQTDGAITLNATSDATIHSTTAAGSVVLAGGQSTGVALSGAGASTQNVIAFDVQASIDGDRGLGVNATDIAITALDTSKIDATTGSISAAASLGLDLSIAVSVGVALAENIVNNHVIAGIYNANHVAATTGAVAIDAHEQAEIDSRNFCRGCQTQRERYRKC